MADDTTKATNTQDRARINVKQDHEVSYWSKKLGETRERIRQAVKDVGVMVSDVKAYFARRRPGRSGA